MAYTTPASLVSLGVFTSNYYNQIVDDLNALSVHDHSGSLGEGASLILAGSSASGTGGSQVYREEIGGPMGFHAAAACVYGSGAITNAIYSFSSPSLPRGIEWGFRDSGASPVVAGEGIVTIHRLMPGNYKLEVYYPASPGHGVVTIYTGASVLIGEVDQYAAASSLKRFSGSFSNSGSSASNLVRIVWLVSSSKNPSATACRIKLSAYSIRWTGS